MKRTSNDVDTQIVLDKEIHKHVSQNKLFLMLIFTLLIGIVYGAILIGTKQTGLLQNLQAQVANFTASRQIQSLIKTFVNSFFSSLLFLVLPYIFGYCAVSQPLCVLVVFAKGLSIGTIVGYFYSFYGLKGFGYSAIMIVPVAVFTSFILIIACREAIKLSNLIFLSLINKQTVLPGCNVLKLYNVKALILLCFMLVSSVVDTILVLVFSRFFVFT